MNAEKIAAIILAAGSSSRMCGVKKEFQKLNDGLTVLGFAVSSFSDYTGIIVIVIPENEETAARQALPQDFLIENSKKIIFVNGGDTRRISVLNALVALTPYNPSYVLIHDGARPWVSPNLIKNIINATKKHDAVIPLLALTDTPKLIERGEQDTVFIKTHLKRFDVGGAQTPQGFKYPDILHAHEKAKVCSEEFTDDAEIWGRFVGKVAVIPGEKENRKITFPEDLN